MSDTLDKTDYSRHISSIDDAISDMRNGKMIVLVDAEDRENEGDLVLPAQMVTPDAINFMAKFGRGLICLTLTDERASELNLEYMSRNNRSQHGTAFTVSIEAREGISTGISAHDRARTVSVAIDSSKTADDIVSPGHIFPLIAREGGALMRAGHTEASVDLARLAGLNPSGVICEIMNDDGTMARLPDLVEFAERHDLKIATIADLIAYRHKYDSVVRRVSEHAVESAFGGSFRMHIYANAINGSEHAALVKGDLSTDEPALVRVHAVNPFTDLVNVGPIGTPSDETSQLQKSLKIVSDEGRGAVVIIRDTGAGTLTAKLGLSGLTDDVETPSTEKRELNIGIGSAILHDLGVREMILLSNSESPRYVGLDGYGLAITGQRSIK